MFNYKWYLLVWVIKVKGKNNSIMIEKFRGCNRDVLYNKELIVYLMVINEIGVCWK